MPLYIIRKGLEKGFSAMAGLCSDGSYPSVCYDGPQSAPFHSADLGP
jgi:hypothetical protein